MVKNPMLAKAYAVSLLGLAGTMVEVESEISSSLPGFVLVGLPDASLSEAKDRVRAAIQNSGLKMPDRRVTVNLSPASVRKHGSGFDLAIAVSVLGAAKAISSKSITEWVHLGELGLDGSVRKINGILPSLLSAKSAGFENAIVPFANLSEAVLVPGIKVLGVKHFREVARLHGAPINDESPIDVLEIVEPNQAAHRTSSQISELDVADVLGQEEAIEAMTVAAVGGHHMLMVGPPGSGKTMMAERLTSILPDLELDQALETTAVLSIAGSRNIAGDDLVLRPPFEAPHHSASVSSLVGGGLGTPRPGVISLANNGVLFLDEAPEFQKPVLEALRQPLEAGEVSINRSGGTAKFPAKFQLVLAANPCPCGHGYGIGRKCKCTDQQRVKYLAKLSGPLLDRIDIRLSIRPASPVQLALAREQPAPRATSLELREQVLEARARAKLRYKETGWSRNSQIPGTFLRRNFPLAADTISKLETAVAQGRMSMRGFDRCLRLAWSNADLAGRSLPNQLDVAKAIWLRGSEEFGSEVFTDPRNEIDHG